MEAGRQNKEEATSNSPKMERKQRGKFVSLSKQEAKIVLETYVKRSFSNCEAKGMEHRKEKKLKRSVSDVTKRTYRANKSKMTIVPQAEVQDNVKKDSEASLPNDEPVVITKAKAVKKQSWFKNFLSQLFKKEENSSEQTVSVVNKVSLTSSTEGHSDHTTKKSSVKKATIRKALSFKKNNADEKLKRPTHLPLKQMYSPCPLPPPEKNEECYYEQVSAEIELLVKDTENLDVSGRKHSSNGDSIDGKYDMESTIKKIVGILQKEGDAYDRKIKEDPALSSFFRDISYSSFKQLADVYVDQGIKKRDSDVTPEDMKFAFSIHFTKQVVGLSTHPANRIMGFGTKYLQDSFTWLSYSMENLTANNDPECISPD